MNSEDIRVVIAAALVFISVLGVLVCIAFDGVKNDAYDTGWIDGYVTAKEEDRRHK